MNFELLRNHGLLRHLLRGALGFLALFGGLLCSAELRMWTLVPLAAALVLFRGCPTCWLAGLVCAIRDGKSARGMGSCALPEA